MAAFKTILLVDDDTDDHIIFSLALEEVDHALAYHTASSGSEALTKLNGRHVVPDWIFIDLNMPKMSGKECLIEIRKLNFLRQVPIYMYSSSVDVPDKASFIHEGANDIFTKPSNISELVKILQTLLV